jgi:hypothetical protein
MRAIAACIRRVDARGPYGLCRICDIVAQTHRQPTEPGHASEQRPSRDRSAVQRQFGSLSWNDATPPDFDTFAADFHADANLYPSSRPSQAQTVAAFVRRMRTLAATDLRRFDETVLGSDIRIFGNIAVATVACEQIENGSDTNRTIEMLLLVKSEGAWQIAAQAWDKSSEANPVPADLLGAGKAG